VHVGADADAEVHATIMPDSTPDRARAVSGP
jgi:hypothetical protein